MSRENRPPPERSRESVSGQIERVTFHDEESGFSVLRVAVKGRREPVTVIGNVPEANAGEWLVAEGEWVRNREHGLQLKADSVRCSPPTSAEGIERYLGSGLIKGIGPVYAKKLVAKFGASVLEILDTCSARLEDVGGIGPGRRRAIKAAWEEQKTVREIMLFLHSHGVGTGRATRIYKTYGESAIETVRENPYALARDIPGIGFKTADGIAARLGIAPESLSRIRAGLGHALAEAASAGHCGLPRENLLAASRELLGLGEQQIGEALEGLLASKDAIYDRGLVYLPSLHGAECRLAARLRNLSGHASPYPDIDAGKALAWVQKKAGIDLSASQAEAFGKAVSARVLVVTGGPGVGKTTLLRAILSVLRAKRVEPLLAAPTGRAAKRLSEATGMEAKTLHRLLEARPGGVFGRNSSRPLDCGVLVVDEASMVDVPLFARVLDALPSKAGLLVVGDADQLPSVGPGSAMADIIASGVVPVARLSEIFRQAATSAIVTNAHRINSGELPRDGDDFFYVAREDPEAISRTLLEIVCKRIPKKLGLDPARDIQVLAPMNKGPLGVRALNGLFQDALNPRAPDAPTAEKFGWEFRLRDKVIQTANDYDKEVYNGDIGRVARIDPGERELAVDFDGREVVYGFGELDVLQPAYAITIHKSQGSEFPAVVLPLHSGHYLMLQRNLLYTGLTRAKLFAVVVGEKRALARAVANAQSARRFSALRERLLGDQ